MSFHPHTNIAEAGRTVALAVADIDADLAASEAVNPTHVLFNLGAVDVLSLPAEVTWKANCQTIFDAMTAKWPGIKIYMMRPWRRDYGTECNTLAGWIDGLVTANPGVVYTGPDERVFIENGDNGTTYTSDGLHPNAAGQLLTAQQWKTTLGW